MSETPSLSQGLQSCPGTQVLLQKANLAGTCLHLGTETEPLVSLGGFLLCQGIPSCPRSQLLMLTADHGWISRCHFGGGNARIPAIPPGWGIHGRLAGGVCAWHALPGSPAGEKDPCDAGFSATAPSGADRMALGASPPPPGPPKLVGCRRCSTVTPSLPVTPCSAPALAASRMTPRHPDSTQPQETHRDKQG